MRNLHASEMVRTRGAEVCYVFLNGMMRETAGANTYIFTPVVRRADTNDEHDETYRNWLGRV